MGYYWFEGKRETQNIWFSIKYNFDMFHPTVVKGEVRLSILLHMREFRPHKQKMFKRKWEREGNKWEHAGNLQSYANIWTYTYLLLDHYIHHVV